jgi:hypothetical protein
VDRLKWSDFISKKKKATFVPTDIDTDRGGVPPARNPWRLGEGTVEDFLRASEKDDPLNYKKVRLGRVA